MSSRLIFATRPSALARWQTGHVIHEMQVHWKDLICEQVVITTEGDRTLDVSLPEIGGKGLFTFELERALLEGRVHAAVHSLKDLPTEEAPGLTLGAISQREDVRDVLICPSGKTLETLPSGSRIGTSSNRRRAQLLAYRPDLQVESIRGNVDTRIRKARQGQYDAILLAAAGVTRLGLQEHITQYIPLELMLPAPGQGALAVQCRMSDEETLRYLKVIDHASTRRAVTAERIFLAGLGGGCALPVAALAQVDGDEIRLQGLVAAPDGSRILRVRATGRDPHQVGQALAEAALERGARAYLAMEQTPGR